MLDSLFNIITSVRGYLLILTIGIYFVVGLLYLFRAIKQRSIDSILLVLIGLLIIVNGFVTTGSTLDNFLMITIGILLFTLVFKLLFGEIIMKGTTKDRLILTGGIFLILLAIFWGYFHLPYPAFLDYLPSF